MHAVTQGFRVAAPDSSVQAVSDAAVNSSGEYLLYRMKPSRRTQFTLSHHRAAAWARELSPPLVVLEPWRVDCTSEADADSSIQQRTGVAPVNEVRTRCDRPAAGGGVTPA